MNVCVCNATVRSSKWHQLHWKLTDAGWCSATNALSTDEHIHTHTHTWINPIPLVRKFVTGSMLMIIMCCACTRESVPLRIIFKWHYDCNSNRHHTFIWLLLLLALFRVITIIEMHDYGFMRNFKEIQMNQTKPETIDRFEMSKQKIA